MILPDLSVATSGDLLVLNSHEFGLLHVGIDHGTILVTKSFTFSIWVPFIMVLNMSVIFVKGVIKVTIDPR